MGENASTPNIGTAAAPAIMVAAAAAAAAEVNVTRVRDAGACCDFEHIMYVFIGIILKRVTDKMLLVLLVLLIVPSYSEGSECS